MFTIVNFLHTYKLNRFIMDEYIISQTVLHLSEKDLLSFALINKQTYSYCTHTNIHNKKCSDKHITYHYVLSLLENAKLSYCINILEFVKILYDNKIPLQKYSIHILLKRPCGTIIKIVFGREIIINSIVYSYNNITALSDLQKDFVNNESKVFNIDDKNNLERLKHKLNSIISHSYIGCSVKEIDNVQGDYHHNIVNQFKINIDKYFVDLLTII